MTELPFQRLDPAASLPERAHSGDAGLDLRFISNASRDRLLSSDPVGERPDIFYDIPAATFYLSRKF